MVWGAVHYPGVIDGDVTLRSEEGAGSFLAAESACHVAAVAGKLISCTCGKTRHIASARGQVLEGELLG